MPRDNAKGLLWWQWVEMKRGVETHDREALQPHHQGLILGQPSLQRRLRWQLARVRVARSAALGRGGIRRALGNRV